MESVEVEVAVVGAGAMGAATAWRLAGAGREVLFLERFSPGHDRGSSGGPARIFRFAYEDPFYVAMAQRALPLWREIEAASGETLLDLCGGVDVGPEESLTPIERALGECGAAFERLPRAGERFSGIAIDAPALYSADTGVVAASASVRAMAALAVASGATLRSGVEARVEHASDSSVTLWIGGERVRARACVLAAGAWTGALVAPLGLTPPLRVTREQVVYFRERTPMPVVIHRGAELRYAVPARFGAPGARVGEHGTGASTTADARSFSPDATGVERVVAYARRALPCLEPEPVEVETCLYTSTPDDDFVIDRAGALVVCSPCSGHGFKFAPLVGEICAALATGAEPPVDIGRFAIARF